VIYTIHIKDKDERIQFAAEIKSLLRTAKIASQDYIPGASEVGKVQADIGIKASIDQDLLAQIMSRIERRGYNVQAKGPEIPGLKLSALSPQ